MKFNFRKFASVLTSAVMLGSTAGLAMAANYPAPFINNGSADVAVVWGASAATTDLVAVTDITANLQASLAKQTATTSGSVVSTGKEEARISGGDKLYIGRSIGAVKTTAFDKADLPSMLADKTYQAKDGTTYTYEQTVKLASDLNYTYFTDTDYQNRAPTLGMKVARSKPVLNYTLSFKKTVESSVSTAGRMTDIENTDITILGKQYKLLNAYNNTNVKLELMAGAVSDVIALDQESTYTIGDKKFDVKLIYVDSTSAKFTINGEDTIKMTVGTTQKLKDGTQVGVRDVLYQNFAGGVMKAEFSLGAEKLTIENGANVKVNDVTQYDLTGYVSAGVSGLKRTVSSIVISWKPDTTAFLTANSSITMPALGSLKILMADPTVPAKETISVANSGAKTMRLSIPIKSGLANIDVVSGNGSYWNNFGGEAGTGKNLVVQNSSAAQSIVFDRDTDDAFIATYISGTTGESYYLRVASLTREDGINYTSIRDLVSGETVCDKKKAGSPTPGGTAGDTCTIGSSGLQLTFADGDADAKNLTITGGSNVYFDRVVSKEGMVVVLPLTVNNTNTPANLANVTSVALVAYEEDKNGNIVQSGPANITINLGWTSEKAEVKSWSAANASNTNPGLQVPGTTTTYTDYLKTDLGSMVTYDTVPTQDTLAIEYHGGQVYGNVLLTVPEATVQSGGSTGGSVKELGSVSVSDADAASVAGKNLVVVGGSCVNKVAADLLGGALCGADFEAKTGAGAGSFLIQTFSRSGDKVATLVAGYNAADTTNAAKYLTTQTVDTTVGKKYVGTSATSAQLVVSQ